MLVGTGKLKGHVETGQRCGQDPGQKKGGMVFINKTKKFRRA